MRAVGIAVCILLLGATSPAPAASEKDANDCKQDKDHKLRIAACSQIVKDKSEGAKERAVALRNRGLSYFSIQRNRRALSDFTAALKIDRKDTEALYRRANVYYTNGEYDRAITDFNAAIAVNPKYAEAFNDRGLAYHGKGDNDRAIADYDAAILIDPEYYNAHYNRGLAFYSKGEHARAIESLNAAIKINPKDADGYFSRSLPHFYSGLPLEALTDMRKAFELNPKDADAVIWLQVLERRSDEPGHLAENSQSFDKKAWPGPVIRLMLGQIGAPDLLTAADSFDRKRRRDQFCEAHFFSGQLELIRSAKERAKQFFAEAARDCPVYFVEWSAAREELKALGVKP